MGELKLIPEQRPTDSHWGLSREFCQVIDRLPYYSGVVLEDSEKVNLGFMRATGFNPIIPLDAYLKGAIYAKLKGKCSNTYVPRELESKVNEKMEKLFREDIQPFSLVGFDCSINEMLERLQKEDSQK